MESSEAIGVDSDINKGEKVKPKCGNNSFEIHRWEGWEWLGWHRRGRSGRDAVTFFKLRENKNSIFKDLLEHSGESSPPWG